LKDITFYTSTTYLVEFISFIRGIIVAKLLNPTLYGYFSGLGLLLLFNPTGNLGMLQGMFREMSIKKGAGLTDETEKIKNAAFSFIGVSATVIFLVLLAYSFIEADRLGPYITWGLRTYALICILQHQEMLYHDLLRVNSQFKTINVSKIIFSLSNVIFSIVLILKWGFYGLLAAFILSMFTENIYLMYRGKYRFKISFEKSTLWHLFRTGFPIALSGLAIIGLHSIDRIMIIRYLSAKELGYYGIALAFTFLLFKFAETISYVMQPRILEHYGKHGQDKKSLVDVFEQSTLILSVVMSILIGVFIIIIGPFITYVLPAYKNSIVVSQILIFGVFFFSANRIALHVLVAMGNFKALLSIQIILIIINVILTYAAIQYGYGINGVAVAASASYFIYCFIMIQVLYSEFKVNVIKAMFKNLENYLPILLIGLILYVTSSITILNTNRMTGDLAADALYSMIRILTLLALFTPFFILIERRTKIISLITSLMIKK
jgi:O-antigen/teichoic acid export membrane protein